MNIKYRKLTFSDLDVFINMRLNQLNEEGSTTNLDLIPSLKAYYEKHISDGTFVSWLAFDNDRIVATSGISFIEKPSTFSCISGKVAIISSMHTLKEYRRNGIAKELLSRVINEAKDYGCENVQVTASNMGMLLYDNFGFKKNDNFATYKL